MDPGSSLKLLLGTAWILPLGSFALIALLGPRMGRGGRYAGPLATAAIVTSCVLSLVALFGVWLPNHPLASAHHGGDDAHAARTRSRASAGQLLALFHTGRHRSGARQAVIRPVAAETTHGEHDSAPHDTHSTGPVYYSGDWYTLARFGRLTLTIGYHIDALTVAMFAMVTLIASCIHVYSLGYMHEELHEVTDHEVTLASGEHLKRRGRFHRFFQYLSLFCFSMLGVLVAGNMLMVFIFWELVGICSYFLIGFYIERHSASTAANKAFIVNRVGDFGMLIGLMAIWSGLGTFTFGDRPAGDGTSLEPGLFSLVRSAHNGYRLQTPDPLVRAALEDKKQQIQRLFLPAWPEISPVQSKTEQAAAVERWAAGLAAWRDEIERWSSENAPWMQANGPWIERTRAELGIPDLPLDLDRWSLADKSALIAAHAGRIEQPLREAIDRRIEDELGDWRTGRAAGDATAYGYALLVVAGLGIFCGCVGKSAQFPLHVWLPDAMEGPTPVSALVHSATMVAAGVYLVGRFYPVFTPEVLLVIAYVGCITLVIAATIALTATDIKRVLAYSTVSQLGYMMLALGVGGWLAGMFHLLTHAFFKSLLFLCSGSVIHAVHTNDMTEMGGLRRKMPVTAYTMLAGCLAIIGAGIPFVVGLSGYYSKDAILEQAWLFAAGMPSLGAAGNPRHAILFIAAAGGAALTAFYMFRLWYMTFAGRPRNEHRYAHAHESPRVMTGPLVVLAVFAIVIGLPIFGVTGLLEQARPAGTLATQSGGLWLTGLTYASEHLSHEPAVKVPVTLIAFSTALAGLLLATVVYAWQMLDATEIRRQFRGVHSFLWNKWWFDELYDAVCVRPVHWAARRISAIDLGIIDGIIHLLARGVSRLARLQDVIVDQRGIDAVANTLAYRTWDLGLSLRSVQTGRLRQYVMFIVLGTITLFLMIAFVRTYAAGP